MTEKPGSKDCKCPRERIEQNGSVYRFPTVVHLFMAWLKVMGLGGWPLHYSDSSSPLKMGLGLVSLVQLFWGFDWTGT